MKVVEEEFRLVMPLSEGRSRGWHLSQILRDLALKMKVLDARWDIPFDESDTTIVQVGLAWEDYLAKTQHPEIDFHPGQMFWDGIYMTMDGLSVCGDGDLAEAWGIDRYTDILHEFKFTCKSSRDFKKKLQLRSPKVLMYLWQIMGYRYAWNRIMESKGLPFNNIAKLHMLFIKGDYNKETEADALAKPAVYRLHFSDLELEENWHMVQTHKREMERHGRVKPEGY